MRLKRLLCRGFKSFADRTEFEFDSKLTGIIGPNGCGKSNVVDALKWVLGDQRPKSLRGAEMTDVIFKGAEGRDAMGLADVRVVLEDPERRFDGHEEVEIGRCLSKDKESSYLLNGQTVRLKDVRDVLLDTGLGVGGYSVMEQGRIDAVLSANPEDRRAIFEEAAGISRFKLQKKESLRKLERTEQNLNRVVDLLEERSRRIRSLKIQAGKARRWRELEARLVDLKAALAVLEGRELRAEQVRQRERLAALEEQVATAAAEQERTAGEVREAEAGIAAADTALQGAQERVHAVQEKLGAARHRADAQDARAKELDDDIAACARRAGALAGQRDERSGSLLAARGNLESLEEELVRLGGALEEADEEHGARQESLKALQSEREHLREARLELLHARTRARNLAHDQEAQRRARETRERRLQERRAALVEELEALGDERTGVEARARDRTERARVLGEREERALADLHEADEVAADLARREAEQSREVSEVAGRRQALEDMEAHMEGLDEGPRHVLASRPEGLVGRLLDLIEIDLEHSAALEAALGPYVQALVVDTRAHAVAILAGLEEEQRGRVLLLVQEEFGAGLDRPSTLPLPAGAVFLADRVRCVPERRADEDEDAHRARVLASQRLLRWLLRGVVLVEDLAAADPGRADLCFVTRHGALLCGPRMEGGAGEGVAGLVTRRSRIQVLAGEEAAHREALAGLQQERDGAHGRVDALKKELRALAAARQAVHAELQEAETACARIEARTADLRREQEELALEAREVHRDNCRALAALGRHLLDVHLIQRREQRADVEENALGERVAAAQRAAEESGRAAQELRLQQVRCRSDRDGVRDGIVVHEQALRDLDRAAQDLEERRREAADGAAAARAQAERLRGEIAGLGRELEACKGERDGRQAEVAAARRRRDEAREIHGGAQERRQEASEAVTSLRLEQADTDHRFARLEERLREETGTELCRHLGEVQGLGLLDPALFHGPEPFPGTVEQIQGPPLAPAVLEAARAMQRLWEDEAFDPGEARKEVKVLQSSLDRLGSVNPDAVEELAAEEEQVTFLEQETEDLKEARRSLMETLHKLESESRTLFLETFGQARENFQLIFRKLFQGGRADMFLTDEENALESGIEIMARPPGKELQSINLLSGGERSMTALAILFAVFKVKPSPFCILDEVDAALDETNVERFLRVLRDFVEQTQFCIVTHHKRTMAECQVLYGITMQKRGVSSRIAVSLDEVDEITEGEGPSGDGGGENGGHGHGGDRAVQERIAGEETLGF